MNKEVGTFDVKHGIKKESPMGDADMQRLTKRRNQLTLPDNPPWDRELNSTPSLEMRQQMEIDRTGLDNDRLNPNPQSQGERSAPD